MVCGWRGELAVLRGVGGSFEWGRRGGWRKRQKRGRNELRGAEGVVLRGVARNNAISAAERPGCDGNDHNRAFCPPETNVLCQTVSFREIFSGLNRWRISERRRKD
jgi:hypothetical protein